MNITLRRVTLNSTGPTYGVLLCDDVPLCVTLERPWLDNAHNVSCIPPGKYICIPHNTADKPNCWQVTTVPGRDDILIHVGNSMQDTDGCILVGLEFYPGGILESKNALDYLRKMLAQNFTLSIINP